MRIIESESVKRRNKNKTKHEQKFVLYWSLVMPSDYAKDMAKKANGKPATA